MFPFVLLESAGPLLESPGPQGIESAVLSGFWWMLYRSISVISSTTFFRPISYFPYVRFRIRRGGFYILVCIEDSALRVEGPAQQLPASARGGALMVGSPLFCFFALLANLFFRISRYELTWSIVFVDACLYRRIFEQRTCFWWPLIQDAGSWQTCKALISFWF